jgi:uroporphyrinogen-III synthase
MRRVLLLRPSGESVAGADLLVTHRIVSAPFGIAATRTFDPAGAILVVSSRATVDVLAAAGASEAFPSFRLVLTAGAGTAAALEGVGVGSCVTPVPPGAVGILSELARRGESGRLLWPRGSDADDAAVDELLGRGFDVTAPVVYLKEPLPALDEERLRAFRAGEYDALAIGSLAALDVFLDALGADGPADLPPVRFGVVGPETARLLVARGFPEPAVPKRPLLTDLIALLSLPKEA